MAQLSPDHGWQVKFSLDFPGAPSGGIEALVMHALKSAAAAGAPSVTFGGGAVENLTPGRNLKGTRFKVLSKAYHAIATELKLLNKSEFRAKLGAVDDPTYGKLCTRTPLSRHQVLTVLQYVIHRMASAQPVSVLSSASLKTATTTTRSRRPSGRSRSRRQLRAGRTISQVNFRQEPPQARVASSPLSPGHPHRRAPCPYREACPPNGTTSAREAVNCV